MPQFRDGLPEEVMLIREMARVGEVAMLNALTSSGINADDSMMFNAVLYSAALTVASCEAMHRRPLIHYARACLDKWVKLHRAPFKKSAAEMENTVAGFGYVAGAIELIRMPADVGKVTCPKCQSNAYAVYVSMSGEFYGLTCVGCMGSASAEHIRKQCQSGEALFTSAGAKP